MPCVMVFGGDHCSRGMGKMHLELCFIKCRGLKGKSCEEHLREWGLLNLEESRLRRDLFL